MPACLNKSPVSISLRTDLLGLMYHKYKECGVSSLFVENFKCGLLILTQTLEYTQFGYLLSMHKRKVP